jgi:hypothetical protein
VTAVIGVRLRGALGVAMGRAALARSAKPKARGDGAGKLEDGRAMRASASCDRLAVARSAEPAPVQRGDDQRARLARRGTWLGLGWMHVHVDLIGRKREEEGKHRCRPFGTSRHSLRAPPAGLSRTGPPLTEILAEAVRAVQRCSSAKLPLRCRRAGADRQSIGDEVLPRMRRAAADHDRAALADKVRAAKRCGRC